MSKSYHRFIIKSLVHGLFYRLRFSNLNRNSSSDGLTILTYHSFSHDCHQGLAYRLPIDRFVKQMKFIRKNFEIIGLNEGLKYLRRGLKTSKPLLSITIDDGFQDNFTIAFPVLKKFEAPATIFLTTDFIENIRMPWPTQIVDVFERTRLKVIEEPVKMRIDSEFQKRKAIILIKDLMKCKIAIERFEYLDNLYRMLEVVPKCTYQPLTWGQVKKMRLNGITFGSHTVYHSMLPEMPSNIQKDECIESKIRIENRLDSNCVGFSFPDGKYDENSIYAVKSCGFEYSVTQVSGINFNNENRFSLKRIDIPYHDPISTFKYRVDKNI